MAKDLILVGAGGFGREVLWQISESESPDYNIIGFVDDAPELTGKYVNNAPILGNIRWLLDYPNEICVSICIANPKKESLSMINLKRILS